VGASRTILSNVQLRSQYTLLLQRSFAEGVGEQGTYPCIDQTTAPWARENEARLSDDALREQALRATGDLVAALERFLGGHSGDGAVLANSVPEDKKAQRLRLVLAACRSRKPVGSEWS
jgi:hypothetical protein